MTRKPMDESPSAGRKKGATFWLTFAIIPRNCVQCRKSSCGKLLTNSNANADIGPYEERNDLLHGYDG